MQLLIQVARRSSITTSSPSAHLPSAAAAEHEGGASEEHSECPAKRPVRTAAPRRVYRVAPASTGLGDVGREMVTQAREEEVWDDRWRPEAQR